MTYVVSARALMFNGMLYLPPLFLMFVTVENLARAQAGLGVGVSIIWRFFYLGMPEVCIPYAQ